MSHYTTFESVMTDPECLVGALVDLGFAEKDIEVHDQAVRVGGYQTEEAMAHVVVRVAAANGLRERPGYAFNDLGWEMTADGCFREHVSDSWANPTWRARVFGAYVVRKTAKELLAMGCLSVSQEATENPDEVEMTGLLLR